MKKTRNNLIASLSLVFPPAFPADLLLFDNPVLTVMRHGNIIKGHYLGRSMESYIVPNLKAPIECEFLFMGTFQAADTVEIHAWEPAIFRPDDPHLTYGLIRIHRDTWKLIFKNIPQGCRSKGDGDKLVLQTSACCDPADLTEKGGLHVKPAQTTPAIGFRILNREQAFIRLDTDSLTQGGLQRIRRGNTVTVLKTSKGIHYVRYVIPKTGEIIHGWMSNDALVDPFKKYKSTIK